MKPPETCPECGADVPPRARCCPECGADEETGWSETAAAQRLGISDPDDFDHDEFIREEFGPAEGTKPQGLRWLWWVVAAVLLVIFVGFYLRMFL